MAEKKNQFKKISQWEDENEIKITKPASFIFTSHEFSVHSAPH